MKRKFVKVMLGGRPLWPLLSVGCMATEEATDHATTHIKTKKKQVYASVANFENRGRGYWDSNVKQILFKFILYLIKVIVFLKKGGEPPPIIIMVM